MTTAQELIIAEAELKAAKERLIKARVAAKNADREQSLANKELSRKESAHKAAKFTSDNFDGFIDAAINSPSVKTYADVFGAFAAFYPGLKKHHGDLINKHNAMNLIDYMEKLSQNNITVSRELFIKIAESFKTDTKFWGAIKKTFLNVMNGSQRFEKTMSQFIPNSVSDAFTMSHICLSDLVFSDLLRKKSELTTDKLWEEVVNAVYTTLFVSELNRSIAEAFNNGEQLARDEFIFFCALHSKRMPKNAVMSSLRRLNNRPSKDVMMQPKLLPQMFIPREYAYGA